jgi:4-hydroxybenzoyl-CoA thioesterase
MTFSTRMRYRFGDIDDAGIAYYPKLLHYFHCAFEDWWSDALGHPYARVMHDDKLGFPAVKLECEFFAPIRYGWCTSASSGSAPARWSSACG